MIPAKTVTPEAQDCRQGEREYPVTLRNTPGTKRCGSFPTVLGKSEHRFLRKKWQEIVAKDRLEILGGDEELIGIDAMRNQSTVNVPPTVLIEGESGQVLEAQTIVVVDLGVLEPPHQVRPLPRVALRDASRRPELHLRQGAPDRR